MIQSATISLPVLFHILILRLFVSLALVCSYHFDRVQVVRYQYKLQLQICGWFKFYMP
jgi:hypothetical protein